MRIIIAGSETMIQKILIFLTLSTSFAFEAGAGEDSTYTFSWLDRDKEVYVLQNRKYRKKNHFIFNIGGGFTTSGAFTSGTALQGKIDYFWHEEFGMEVSYTLNDGDENTTAATLRNNAGGAGANPFRRITQNYFGAMFLWSPFYSKINSFNRIVYLDWIIGLGFGKLDEKNNKHEVQLGTTRDDIAESHQGPMWSFGALFYLSKMYSLKFDVNGFHYRSERVFSSNTNSGDDIWTSHVDLTALIGVRF